MMTSFSFSLRTHLNIIRDNSKSSLLFPHLHLTIINWYIHDTGEWRKISWDDRDSVRRTTMQLHMDWVQWWRHRAAASPGWWSTDRTRAACQCTASCSPVPTILARCWAPALECPEVKTSTPGCVFSSSSSSSVCAAITPAARTGSIRASSDRSAWPTVTVTRSFRRRRRPGRDSPSTSTRVQTRCAGRTITDCWMTITRPLFRSKQTPGVLPPDPPGCRCGYSSSHSTGNIRDAAAPETIRRRRRSPAFIRCHLMPITLRPWRSSSVELRRHRKTERRRAKRALEIILFETRLFLPRTVNSNRPPPAAEAALSKTVVED